MTPSCMLRRLAVALLLGPAGLAQTIVQGTSVPRLTFDVASIRVIPESSSYSMSVTDRTHDSTFIAINFNLSELLSHAFGVNQHRIEGLPDCCVHSFYTVHAKSDNPADDRLAKLNDHDARLEKQHMLQTLLVDRMKLTYHWEDRERPALALVVLRSGWKFEEGKPLPLDPEKPWLSRPLYQQGGDGIRDLELVAHGASISDFAGFLGSFFGKDVLDRTGLTGLYTFTLQYHGTEEDDTNTDPNLWPPIPRALRERLGLTLEPIKAPSRILVIDHLEKPSEN